MSVIHNDTVKRPLELVRALLGIKDDLVSVKAGGTGKTLSDELHDDHETFKDVVDELVTDSGTYKTVVDEIKTQLNALLALLVGDFLDGPTALGIGSTKPNVANGAFEFHIDGVEYQKAVDAVGTALSGDTVPQNQFGAWALDIGANGTIDITPAADNVTGYASSAAAIADIPAVAADHVRMGTCDAVNTGAAFIPGTTDLDNGTVTDLYVDGVVVAASVPSAVSNSAPTNPSNAAPASLTADKETAVGTLETS